MSTRFVGVLGEHRCMSDDSPFEQCSIENCPRPASTSEHGRVGHWYVTIFYCAEHRRELNEGTPLGPMGVDLDRIRVEPVGEAAPATQPGRMPGID